MDRLPTPLFLGFPCGSAGKESACNVGDLGSICGLGRSPGEGKGYPLQYSGMENSMDLYSPTRSQRVGHNWATFTFHFQVSFAISSLGDYSVALAQDNDLGEKAETMDMAAFSREAS